MHDRTDDELIYEALSQDRDAFEALVLRHRPRAVRFAAGIVGPDAAEDMAQEAFAKVYLRLSAYQRNTSFKSWLLTIVRNTCIDYMRKQMESLPLEETIGPLEAETPSDAIIKAEEWQALRFVWNRLAKDARCALYLYAYEELPYRDIAAAMGKSTAQVKMIIYRARKKLKKELSKP